MADLSQIQEHAEVIGADGVHVGTVDEVEGNRIKLTKQDSAGKAHQGHHHFIFWRSCCVRRRKYSAAIGQCRRSSDI